MAFFRCDVMSESLGMATSVLVTMPDTGDLAAAPVVYLLHGCAIPRPNTWPAPTGLF